MKKSFLASFGRPTIARLFFRSCFAVAVCIPAALCGADLAVTLHRHTPEPPVLDRNNRGFIDYYFTLQNNSNADSGSYTVTITTAGQQLYEGSASLPISDNGNGTYSFSGNALAAKSSYEFRISFEVDTPGLISATTKIETQGDPVPGNNSAKESATVLKHGQTDLQMVSVTVTPNPAKPGDLKQYHGVLKNAGPDTAYGIQVGIQPDSQVNGQGVDKLESFQGATPAASPAAPDSGGNRYLPIGTIPANKSVEFDAYYLAKQTGSVQRNFFISLTDQETDPNVNNDYLPVLSTIDDTGTGGLSPALLTVDGTTSASDNVADTTLRFAARETGNVSGLLVRVQTSTNGGSWTNLPDGNDGHMVFASTGQPPAFVLNSANYPLQSGVSFRAAVEAPGYDPIYSNEVGPFDLTKKLPHLGPTVFTMQGSRAAFGVIPTSEIIFAATESKTVSGVTVHVQTSTTPDVESSWADLSDGNDGKMTAGTDATQFTLTSRDYPAGSNVYFRAIAVATNYVPSPSNIIGPFTLVVDTPPVVTITPPDKIPGSKGTGTEDDPINVLTGTFRIGASATSKRQITNLAISYDGDVLDQFNGDHGSIEYTTNVPLLHRIKAVAQDDLGTVGESDIYIRVLPRNARVFFMTNSGDWNTASNWTDTKGKHGVPGDSDVAVVGALNATIANDTTVFAAEVSGGSISGTSKLNVSGYLVISAGELRDMNLVIEPTATCQLINDVDVAMNILITNLGTMKMSGDAGISGVGSAAASANRDGATTNGFNLFAALQNFGKFLFQRRPAPARKTVKPPARTVNVSTVHNAGVVASNSRAGLIGQDGNGLIGQDGNGLIGQDGNGLIGQDGNGFKSHGGSAAMAERNATATASAGYTQDAGETNLDDIRITGSVALNGGVLSGSGVIDGDLTNAAGYIMPGDSPGAIAVTGNFAQQANGSLILEVAGADPLQFDHLVVAGTAKLAGTLDLKAIDGYKTAANDILNPIAYKSVTGSFASVSSDAQVQVNATGLVAFVNSAAPQPQTGQPLNISTRLKVLNGDNVPIAGFIVTGPSGSTKKVLIRGLGPSLSVNGTLLADPYLELHKPDGTVVTNDNWQDASNSGDIPNGFGPKDPKESAVLVTLAPGSYTAVIKGAHGETGIGLVEVYDLDSRSPAQLANISTRGFVDTGANVLIAGLIVGGEDPARPFDAEPARFLIRAVGPSLTNHGVTGALKATTLELHDQNGATISNDGWEATQESAISATGAAPESPQEAAILATLVPGFYTAIVRGASDTTGVASVEAYNLH